MEQCVSAFFPRRGRVFMVCWILTGSHRVFTNQCPNGPGPVTGKSTGASWLTWRSNRRPTYAIIYNTTPRFAICPCWVARHRLRSANKAALIWSRRWGTYLVLIRETRRFSPGMAYSSSWRPSWRASGATLVLWKTNCMDNLITPFWMMLCCRLARNVASWTVLVRIKKSR